MSIFGIWPILEIRRGMRPGYILSRFQEHCFALVGFKLFLAFCPFSKRTEACDPVIHLSRFHERFWHLAHFRNTQEAFAPVILFLVFMGDLKKVKVNFRSVFQLKYKKLVKKKFSFPAIKKRLDFNENRV